MKPLSVQLLKWFSILSLLCLCSNSLYAQFVDYYDIYVYDLKTGTTRQVSSIPMAGEYNCSWSPNSKKIVSEAVDAVTFTQAIYVTDVASGVSTLLTGGDGGNDATWSPNGQNILFEKNTNDWYSGIFAVPAEGGEPTLLRDHAISAAWSNNSQYIIFLDEDMWTLKTMCLKDKSESSFDLYGENPAWSPNGQYIAFNTWAPAADGSWFYGIWIIKVDETGKPLGDPFNLTSSGGGASWSNNSKTIVYSDVTVIDAENTDAGDIYSISVEGGTPQRICGRVDTQFGDYDPCYSNNGQYIAFSSATNPPKSKLALSPGNDPFKNKLQVSVMGNPSKSDFRLNFQSKSSEIISLRVLDATGKTILNQAGIQPNSIMRVGNDFSKGVYFVEVRQGTQRKVMKLLKQ